MYGGNKRSFDTKETLKNPVLLEDVSSNPQLWNAKILKSWLPTDIYIYFVRKGANFYFFLNLSILLMTLLFILCPHRKQQPGLIKNLTNAVTFKHPKYTKMPTI